MLFEYSNYGTGNGTVVARFDIIWSSDSNNQAAVSLDLSTKSEASILTPQHRLDNSDNLNVIIYKCEHLASNCGLCLGLELKKFECGWCDVDLRCTHVDDCPRESGWLTKASGSGGGTPICPHPRIEDFSPKKGPINGGTKVSFILRFLSKKLFCFRLQ